jgi:hypothetical protein
MPICGENDERQKALLSTHKARLSRTPSPGASRELKAKPNTTSCQLRFGIEHVFPKAKNPLNIIFNCVGFSHRTDFLDNAIAERFFEEDRLVGIWRPWFNIDSER